MGSLLLAAGEKGSRFALPNSRIMVHQPSGGFQGQASDIQRHAEIFSRSSVDSMMDPEDIGAAYIGQIHQPQNPVNERGIMVGRYQFGAPISRRVIVNSLSSTS